MSVLEDYTVDAFANREGPVSLITASYDDVHNTSSSELDSSSQAGRARGEASTESARGRQSLQDRLLSRLLSQVMPSEDQGPSDDESAEYKDSVRPPFSLPTMTSNFRRFNARIGIVFVFQNKVVRLLSWRRPSHTLSLLTVYSFICLNPYLVVALPLAIALLFIMVPAFTSRHPPPPRPVMASSSAISNHDVHSAYSYSGPPVAPARTIKPASETSKDFFRNMRDLQNSMADFSDVHDTLVDAIAPATNFSNEILSSTLFLYLTVLTTFLFVAAHLIPFRLVFLIGGNAMIVSGHPQAQVWLIKQQKWAEKKAAHLEKSMQLTSQADRHETAKSFRVAGLSIRLPVAELRRQLHVALSVMSQITLNTVPEVREVEIFELQYRPLLPSYSSHQTASTNPEVFEWQPYLFTVGPYDPLSPARISGERPKGTRFFEDVQPPSGWEWSSKKWELDLEAGEWVGERLIVGVEYDVLHRGEPDDFDTDAVDEGSTLELEKSLRISSSADTQVDSAINSDIGGWVWDLPPPPGSTHDRDEEVWLAYGDYDIPSLARDGGYGDDRNRGSAGPADKMVSKSKKGSHRKERSDKSKASKDWEESVRYGDKERTGEWRRRRWVRAVKRKVFSQELDARNHARTHRAQAKP